MLYIYTTTIIKDTTNTIGYNPTAESAAKSDYETNFRSLTVKVNDLVVAETSFEIDKTYTDFKALIDGTTIKWSDVKEMNGGNIYELHLITESPL